MTPERSRSLLEMHSPRVGEDKGRDEPAWESEGKNLRELDRESDAIAGKESPLQ